jgi:hypothetical protein
LVPSGLNLINKEDLLLHPLLMIKLDRLNKV